jgi:hypothetical protein
MALGFRNAFTIAEVAARWEVTPARVAEWALGGAIMLSIVIPTIEVAGTEQPLGDLAEAPGGELWPLFRPADPKRSVMVRRVRPSGTAAWGRIVDPREGLGITIADVHVTPGECERFERGLAHKLTSSGWKGKGGRPPMHDWDALYGWAARRVHDQGLPATQAELVREALDWLAAQGDDALPDESTVRRKLAGFWRALVSPAA